METYILYKQFAKPPEVKHSKQEIVDFWMELHVQACKPTLSTARCPVRVQSLQLNRIYLYCAFNNMRCLKAASQ